MIYHVTTEQQWQHALSDGFFEEPSLKSEGFIHMCTKEQIAGVLDRYYKNMENLLLLHVDETKLHAELKLELSASVNQLFPHVYGTINLESVVKTESIQL
jgi:uncharacterized protein (DUF952 family)